MLIWRLAKTKQKNTAFSGHGAALEPGRWNHMGYPLVYTSGSLSLAALEILVNAASLKWLSKAKMVSISAHIPDDLPITNILTKDLPINWRRYNQSSSALRDIGADWLNSQKTAVLCAPSAVVPAESNYLLNPVHPDFAKIKLNAPGQFKFDTRLFKSEI